MSTFKEKYRKENIVNHFRKSDVDILKRALTDAFCRGLEDIHLIGFKSGRTYSLKEISVSSLTGLRIYIEENE